MGIAVHPRLGQLLLERSLTLAELRARIEARYLPTVDPRALVRLTYEEPIHRADLTAAAAAAAVLGVTLADLFEVTAEPLEEAPDHLTPSEASRMAELFDAQARRELVPGERVELRHLVDEHGRRHVERYLRMRAERDSVGYEDARQRETAELELAASRWAERERADPSWWRKLPRTPEEPGGRRRRVVKLPARENGAPIVGSRR